MKNILEYIYFIHSLVEAAFCEMREAKIELFGRLKYYKATRGITEKPIASQIDIVNSVLNH